jgi:hypothetical protein
MAKAAFNKKMTLFTGTLDLELRKKLVKCYIWSIALYGAEIWTLRAVDQKHLESFEMWCWRRMEKISWTDHVRNEEVLLRVKEQKNILHEMRKRKAMLISSTFRTRNELWRGTCLKANCHVPILLTRSHFTCLTASTQVLILHVFRTLHFLEATQFASLISKR